MISDAVIQVFFNLSTALIGLIPPFELPDQVGLGIDLVSYFMISLNWLLPVKEVAAAIGLVLIIRGIKAGVLWILKFIPTMG